MVVTALLASAVTPVTSVAAAPEKNKSINVRDVPVLRSEPPKAEPVAPATPKADFTPLGKAAGTSGSHFDPERSKIVRQSLFETEYENPDGTRTIKQSTEPRNVQDAGGRWHEVDTTLQADVPTRRIKARQHPLKPTFGAKADDPSLVTVEFEGNKVALGVEKPARGTEIKVSGESAEYADVTPDTDLQYEVTPGSVKETIKLKKPPATNKWRFTLRTGTLTPAVTEQGTVELRDAAGTAKIVMPPVVTWDSSGDNDTRPPARTGGGYAVEKSGDKWILTVSVDEAWLKDPKRVYPVSVDPTFTYGVTYSEAYKSDGYKCVNCGIKVGNVLDHGDKYWRSAMRFNYESMYGKKIVGAKVDVANQRSPMSPDKTWAAHLYHASAMDFNGVGGHMATTMLGQVGTFQAEGLRSFLQHVADIRHMATFLIVGHEAAGTWTYKDLTATMTVDTGNAPPAPQPVGPADHEAITTLAPTLSVTPVSDSDGDPVKYCFKVATGPDAKSGVVVDSGCLDSPTWTVPQAVLQDGVSYTWQAHAYSGVAMVPSPVRHFKIDQRIGDRGPAPADTFGPVTVNLANGNLTAQQSSPTFNTVGGSAGITMTYNSQQQDAKGLRASYFPDLSHNGEINPQQQPVLVRTEPQVNVDWGDKSPFAPALPQDWFVARWEGFFQAPATGTYQFAGVHDDRLRVWVNGNSVYDQGCCSDVNWGVAGSVSLTAGQRVPIKVELAEATHWAYLRLFVRTTEGNVSPQIVPADWLYTSDLPTLPKGWTLSADLDGDGSTYTEAKVTDQNVVLTDGSGAKHTYVKKSAGGYTAPEGEDGVLSLDTAGRITLTEGAEIFVFRSDGKLESMSSVQDSRKPSALQNIYDGFPSRLKEIKDPVSQRSHRLHYNRAGDDCYGGAQKPPHVDALPPTQMLCRIVYWDGTETKLWYYQGRLARIEDPGAENNDYGYNADGLLTGARDALGNDWVAADPANRPDHEAAAAFGYTTINGKPYANDVVAQVPAPGKQRPRHKYRYDTANRTSYVDVEGLSPAIGFFQKVTYDEAFRELSTTDATGKTATKTWSPKDLLLSSTDSAGRRTTTVYNNHDRPVDSYGPAPASCFSGQVPTAACATTVPHTRTAYDEGINGLATSFYDNANLSGMPKVHQTGLGNADGTMARDFSSNAPATGIPVDNFSMRATGEIVFPEAGDYKLRLQADDGVRMWVDDQLVVDDWIATGPKWRESTVKSTGAGSTKKVRIEYYDGAATALFELHWTTPGGAQQVVPGANLKPLYGLKTSETTSESHGVPNQSSVTRYGEDGLDPTYGIATSTESAGLVSKATHEAPGTGYLRKTGKTMPTGAKTTYEFYGDTETRDNPCTPEVEAINQGGMPEKTTSVAPASGTARVDEQIYDASGRVVAKGTSGAWFCYTLDARDRVVTQKVPSNASAPERVITTNHAVNGNPLVSSISDANGTVTTEIDLLGRTVAYTDVTGMRTETTYDLAGRVSAEKVIPPNPADVPQIMASTYDDAGRVLTVSLNAQVLSTTTYNAAGETASVTYANGTTLSDIQLDGAGKTVSQKWRTRDGKDIVSTVGRSRAGTIVDETLGGVDARPGLPNYVYDTSGRMVEAWVQGHHYTYDFTSSAPAGCPAGTQANAGLNTNRVRLLDETASGVAETGYCYDAADRLLTTTGAAGVTDLRYNDRGAVTEYKSGGATTYLSWDGGDRNIHARTTGAEPADVSYTRDVLDRIVRRVSSAGAENTDTIYGFTGSGDTADFAMDATKKIVSRSISLPGGVLLTVKSDTRKWDHPSIRGDLSLTTDDGGLQVGGLRTYSPFGEPLADVPDNQPGDMDYGWLGQHQRPYEHSGSLAIVQMGARPYSPLLGRFLSVDPEEGGSANDYDYTNANPINETDLDGKWSCGWCSRAWNGAKNLVKKGLDNKWVRGIATGIVVAGVCVGTAGVGCAVGVGVAVGAGLGAANWYVNRRNENPWGHVIRGGIWGGLGALKAFGAAKLVAKRFPAAVTHKRGLFGFKFLTRYGQAKSRFQPSLLWAGKRIFRSKGQAKFRGRYR
ncbi:PA14 domain-containing protein [Lentzea pudingi]|uniref:PA14 domain-containing protein n=1 Tax=Lentzea pudingi TaxID=1789439 RepID=UPI0016661A09|nr:PA14 domain-containing protein [Lentzea pudingi]